MCFGSIDSESDRSIRRSVWHLRDANQSIDKFIPANWPPRTRQLWEGTCLYFVVLGEMSSNWFPVIKFNNIHNCMFLLRPIS